MNRAFQGYWYPCTELHENGRRIGTFWHQDWQSSCTVGEWCDITNDIAPWDTEAGCQAFVDRVRPKFEETAIFDVYEKDDGKWDVALFDSRYTHWREIWHHCRKHGIEFEEARKAFLRGELEEFLVSKGTIKVVEA